MELPVKLTCQSETITTQALLDSGAAGNFIDEGLVRQYKIPLTLCESPLAVAALDGRPLGTGHVQYTTTDLCLQVGAQHTETTCLFVIHSPHNPIILGLPWLQDHNSQISCREKQIIRWDPTCYSKCLKPTPLILVKTTFITQELNTAPYVPPEYVDLMELFSKTKASQLPPHHSPSVFQSFINHIFRDMLNQCLIVYINDILIYSDTMEEHIKQVREVLQRLINHQLYAKAEKCEFHQSSISFLGYIISPEGVSMDEGKVRAVLNWPQPTTVKELQRFLGFANFYRRFIRNFSSVTAPLNAMVKGGITKLCWTTDAI